MFVMERLNTRLQAGKLSTLQQWQFDCKDAALSQSAFCFDMAAVPFNNCFYITEAKTKSFYVVYVARMCPVEPFEDPLYCFPVHADTVILDLHRKGLYIRLRTEFDDRGS